MSTKFVPSLLSQEQKEFHCRYCWSCDCVNSDSGFFTKSDHWRQFLGIWLWYWNKNAGFSLENAKLTISKESVSIEIKCESHVDHFIWYWTNFSSWIHALRYHRELGILQRSVRTPTKQCAMKVARKVEGWICAASWQHSVSHVSCHPSVFGR